MRKKAFGDQPVQVTMMHIPVDLYKQLKLQAIKDDRTYAQQVVHYISQGLERDRGKK